MSPDQPRSTLVRKLAVAGFNEGYATAADMLTDPAAATWLASETGLPVERCRVLLQQMRSMMLAVAPRSEEAR